MADTMRNLGIPVNRKNFIRENWGRDIPNEEWTPEHEEELPPELREGMDPP